jgi:hypothetical protein
MATASESPGTLDAAQVDRRVRHPLDAVRGHIRRYVLLEGLAVAIIYLAICFWVGLILDYGLFWLFAFDWVQELQQLTIDPATGAQGSVDTIIRGTLLCLFLAGLAAVVVWKLLLRLTREFNDPAVALVLERQFPRELGDRLITAVEMADPKLADKYGYSKTMIARTIQDAADRVEKVPVREVFNWARLRRLRSWCVLLAIGVYVLVGIGASIFGAAARGSAAPLDFIWNFNDTAAIWTERNLLLMDSYWPRRAYLEVVRFQDAPSHRGEMRVGQEEQRPDVKLRAIQWVIADRESPDGWRALRWRDLPNFLDKNLLDQVAVPESFGHWLVDLDDLDPAIPGGVLPLSWQGKTVAEARAELPGLQAGLKKADADRAAHELLDWRSWTLDKIQLQENKWAIREVLRAEHPAAHRALEEVFSKVAELAETARYSRTLRKLVIPESIHVYYRGATTKSDRPENIQTDHKYSVGLSDLKESVRFTARGEDYFTPYKKITLVPPPGVEWATVDKEEPAYIYYRVQGDQKALKGKKQLFFGYTISSQGDASTIQVPFGTNLVLHAQVDRPLKDGIRMRPPATAEDRGATVPEVPVALDAGGRQFAIGLRNIVKPYDFLFEFNDRDNVKGRRRIRVQPLDDRPPEVIDVELDAVLRKPRLKHEAGKVAGMDGFLVTPDALLPFKGTIRDDYGLTRAVWVHEAQQVRFELMGPGPGGKADGAPALVFLGNASVRHGFLAASYFHVLPGTPSLEVSAPAYCLFMTRLFSADLAHKRSEGEEQVPMEGFQRALEGRSIDELPLNALDQMIQEHAREQKRRQKAQDEKRNYVPGKSVMLRPLLKDHSLRDEEGFDLKKYLPRLKSLDPSKEAQFHYLLKISIEAIDNNVETGPGAGRNKAPFTFLVVSENELLGQIAIEEEVLRDRLDKAAFKLRNAKTSVDEQVGKLSMAGADYTLVSLRVDDVRKTLMDTGAATREVATDYRRILKELDVNRVRRAKTEDVRDKIVLPLMDIVDPNVGNFVLTEAALEKLYTGLDDDLTLKRGDVNRPVHGDNARTAAQQLDRLLQRLNEVLIAMNEGVVESKLLELIVNIERDQRNIAERARFLHNREVENLLELLIQPKDKERDIKKK